MQRQAVGKHQQRARGQSPRSNASNGPAEYKSLGRGGGSADQGTDFKQGQRGHVGPFRRAVCVYLAEREGDRACCEEVCARVPG